MWHSLLVVLLASNLEGLCCLCVVSEEWCIFVCKFPYSRRKHSEIRDTMRNKRI